MIEKRFTKTGEVRWRAVVRRTGFKPKIKTFHLKSDAEDFERETTRTLLRRRAGLGNTGSRALLSELAEDYKESGAIEEQIGTKSGRSQRRTQLDWWVENLPNEQAFVIRPKQIRAPLEQLGVADPTKNRYLATLSQFYSWAMEKELLDRNPVAQVRRFKESQHIVRYLTDDERTAVLEQCQKRGSDEFYALVLVSLWSGGDRGEVLNLLWRNIDLTESLVVYPWKRKGKGVPRSVPVPDEVIAALKELGPGEPDDRVFSQWGQGAKGPRYTWKKCLEGAKVEGFRWKDLRHSFCSWLVQRGVPLADVRDMAGHTDIKTTLRYAHLSPSGTRDRVRKALDQREPGKVLEFKSS